MTDVPREQLLGAASAVTQTHQHTGMAGAQLGPYQLLDLIGEGGMGEVWLAEQVRPLRRKVAVKIVKAGLDSAQVLARFEAERQALAVMDHPAIAGVLDAGSTDQGRPYFAMEYVRGETLMSYVDHHRLTVVERLELFTHICEGVQHAHQKGIIHRDLKPSNVLVTLQDDKAAPKIIDFGVAKAMSLSLTEHTLYTSLGGFVGTAEYMSPEQAQMGGVDIDTRTDIYALGVVLYELLTGTLPFDRQIFTVSGIDDVRRMIREVNPQKPSTRVAHLGSVAGTAASNRQTDPSHLKGMLRGDLDWIVMKALEKDRSRRYGSATEFAADIRRHMDNLPVLAGPPSSLYRSRKFIQRHRFGVATAAALVILLMAFSILVALQARRIGRERDRANLESAAAKQVSDFLINLFKISDPSEARGNTLTAREILDKGAREVDRTLENQPEVRGRLQTTIGTVYMGLGLYRQAEPLLQRAVDNDERTLGSYNLQTVTAKNALANLYWFQGRYREAEPLYKQVIEIRYATLGEHHPDTLRADFDLATLYAMEGHQEEAERLLRKTATMQRQVLGPRHADTLGSLGSLASVLYRQGRYIEAEPLTKEVLELNRQTLGEQHPDTLISMHNLATTYDRLGRFEEAERIFVQTIAIKRRVLGAAHDSTVLTIVRLSEMYRRMKRYADAERELLGIASEIEAATSVEMATREMVDRAIVGLYQDWQRPEKAAEWRRKLPPDSASR